jgi:hypothetical protein
MTKSATTSPAVTSKFPEFGPLEKTSMVNTLSKNTLLFCFCESNTVFEDRTR